MAKSCFVIIRIDFDSMENHSPEISAPVGVAHSRETADKFIEQKISEVKHWTKSYYSTKDLYPKFSVKEVEETL